MTRKYAFLLLCLCLLTGLNGCRQQTNPREGADSLQTDTLADTALVDTTMITGISGEFGMSTFTLATASGDTLELLRDGEDGSPAAIYGSLVYDTRYAVTLRDGGEALATAYNLDELDRMVARLPEVERYRLHKGMLILYRSDHADTVQVEFLGPEAFLAKAKDGHEYKVE